MHEKRLLKPRRRQLSHRLTTEERTLLARIDPSAKERARIIQVSVETYLSLASPEGVVGKAVVDRVRARLAELQHATIQALE